MPKFGLVGKDIVKATTATEALAALSLTAATLNLETLGLVGSGNVWYVDSGVAGSTGISPATAVATLAAGVALAAANNGDIIVVHAGHAESLSDSLLCDLNTAGITIVGLGSGADRPTITMAHADATLTFSAASVTLHNFLFLLTADATVVCDVNATDVWINQCEFRARTAATAREYVTAIDINGGSANACDRAKVTNCLFTSTANAGSTQAIELGEVADQVVIAGNTIDGDWSAAGIHNPTGKVLTNLRIEDNVVRNRQTGDHAIELVSACTGTATGNRLFADTAGTVFDPGSLFCADNWESSAVDIPAVPSPLGAADVATNFVGVDDADNAVATTNVAANEDGSVLERLEQIQEAVNIGSGTSLAANKSLVDAIGSTGSAVTRTFGATLAGEFLAIPRCVVKTDGAVLSGNDDIFTVAGGPVLCQIYGLVTTLIGGAANGRLKHTTTAPAATIDLNAGAVAINDDAVGTVYTTEGATGVFTPSSGLGFKIIDPVTIEGCWFFLAPGTTHFNGSAAQSGVIAWYMRYIPLSTASTVSAAA